MTATEGVLIHSLLAKNTAAGHTYNAANKKGTGRMATANITYTHLRHKPCTNQIGHSHTYSAAFTYEFTVLLHWQQNMFHLSKLC